MADHLARIHGTEQDRFNCSFFGKMGACRHGEKCDRRHNRPTESQTLLFANMYTSPPQYRPGPHGDIMVSEREMEEAFEEFYLDTFVEIAKLGAIEELNVCANPGLHLAGNVYVKFSTEKQAAEALQKLEGRLYDGRNLHGELCPVTDFREARCKQYSSGSCDRRMCNFLHLREPNSKLQHQLYRWQLEEWKRHRHLEAPPPGAPPSTDRYHESRGGYRDRYDDRRGRYDDRRGGGGGGGGRYDDRRGGGRRDYYNRGGRSPSPDRRGRGDGDAYESDPFGRDVRSQQYPPPGRFRDEPESGFGEAMSSSERELQARLAQVRQEMADQQGYGGDSRKRERPEGGFDHDGPERAPKSARYGP